MCGLGSLRARVVKNKAWGLDSAQHRLHSGSLDGFGKCEVRKVWAFNHIFIRFTALVTDKVLSYGYSYYFKVNKRRAVEIALLFLIFIHLRD